MSETPTKQIFGLKQPTLDAAIKLSSAAARGGYEISPQQVEAVLVSMPTDDAEAFCEGLLGEEPDDYDIQCIVEAVFEKYEECHRPSSGAAGLMSVLSRVMLVKPRPKQGPLLFGERNEEFLVSGDGQHWQRVEFAERFDQIEVLNRKSGWVVSSIGGKYNCATRLGIEVATGGIEKMVGKILGLCNSGQLQLREAALILFRENQAAYPIPYIESLLKDQETKVKANLIEGLCLGHYGGEVLSTLITFEQIDELLSRSLTLSRSSDDLDIRYSQEMRLCFKYMIEASDKAILQEGDANYVIECTPGAIPICYRAGIPDTPMAVEGMLEEILGKKLSGELQEVPVPPSALKEVLQGAGVEEPEDSGSPAVWASYLCRKAHLGHPENFNNCVWEEAERLEIAGLCLEDASRRTGRSYREISRMMLMISEASSKAQPFTELLALASLLDPSANYESIQQEIQELEAIPVRPATPGIPRAILAADPGKRFCIMAEERMGEGWREELSNEIRTVNEFAGASVIRLSFRSAGQDGGEVPAQEQGILVSGGSNCPPTKVSSFEVERLDLRFWAKQTLEIVALGIPGNWVGERREQAVEALFRYAAKRGTEPQPLSRQIVQIERNTDRGQPWLETVALACSLLQAEDPEPLIDKLRSVEQLHSEEGGIVRALLKLRDPNEAFELFADALGAGWQRALLQALEEASEESGIEMSIART